MKVTPLNNITKSQPVVFQGQNTWSNKEDLRTEFVPTEDFSKYKKAQKYADSIIKKHGYVDLRKCNLEKLDGLQRGIEVFEGLSIKQIALLYKHLTNLMIYRGCTNGCVHCFANAIPPANHKQARILQSMPWEDFKLITSGFAKLNERLGWSQAKIMDNIAPFIDADCMEIILKDKSGNSYDFVDIAKTVKSEIGKPVLFDTSGWNPKSPIMQKRAEKYVADISKEFTKGDNANYFGVNISLNPFHKLNAKYAELINSNPAKAKMYRDIYTTRMANVFYTFTPIFHNPKVRFLNRAIEDNIDGVNELFKLSAHKQLIAEIREKLEAQYKANNFSQEDIKKNLGVFDLKVEEIRPDKMIAIGRMKELFKADSQELLASEKRNKIVAKNPLNILDRPITLLFADTNGKIYATDFQTQVLTDIKLNISGKNEVSPKLFPQHEKIITTGAIFKELGYLKIKNHTNNIFYKILYYLKNLKL